MDHLLSREKFDKTLRRIIYHPTVEYSCLRIRQSQTFHCGHFSEGSKGKHPCTSRYKGVLYPNSFLEFAYFSENLSVFLTFIIDRGKKARSSLGCHKPAAGALYLKN